MDPDETASNASSSLERRTKSSSVLATERLLAAKGLSTARSDGEDGLAFSPHHPYYVRWCLGAAAMAMLMAFIDPLHLAFGPADGLHPYDDFWAVIEYITIAVFGIDMALKFFVAYDDPEQGMVYKLPSIALNYLKFWFWVDLITTLPIESIAIAGVDECRGQDEQKCLFLGLIRWINLARLYRVVGFFGFLDRKLILGQISLTVLRTTTLLIVVAHWMGCWFWFIARAEGFSEHSWAGAVDYIMESDPWAQYFYSLYFSFIVATGFGDNDLHDQNYIESIVIAAYLTVSILMNAYILGSITTVMVSDDEKSNVYHDRVESLRSFAEQKELPESLHELMREHLELLHHTEATSDEVILRRYPPTLRKKVLRHLYLDIFKSCYLFKGCKGRFLDEIISTAHMEVFNPHMEVLIEGEVVDELFVIVQGQVHGAKSDSSASNLRKAAKAHAMSRAHVGGSSHRSRDQDASMKSRDASARERDQFMRMGSKTSVNMSDVSGSARLPSGSMRTSSKMQGGSMRQPSMGAGSMMGSVFDDAGMLEGGGACSDYSTGQCFGEISFFTDSPCLQNYWTSILTHVLILSKSQLNELTDKYPKEVKRMLSNLKQFVEENFKQTVSEALAQNEWQESLTGGDPYGMQQELPQPSSKALTNDEADQLHAALTGMGSFTAPTLQKPLAHLKGSLPSVDDRCKLDLWQKAMSITTEHLREKDQQAIYSIIAAGADADIATVKKLLAWGVPAGSMDYDRRTPLMVSSHENNAAVVRCLLEAGAPPNEMDAFGITAMYEAVRMGHAEVIDVLVEFGGQLGMDNDKVAGIITEAIVAGDLVQLQWLMHAGAEATWGDHDGRTPLHFAAGEGAQSAIEILIDEGHACVDVPDRFGRTPADYARKAGNKAVAEHLEALEKEGKTNWTETEWFLRCQQECARRKSSMK